MHQSVFGDKTTKPYPTTKVKLRVMTQEEGIISMEVNIIDHLTSEIPTIKLDNRDLQEMMNQIQFNGEARQWMEPEILAGSDYFHHLIL
ncbi:unnamed protein product [Litomosoides sigmodontis]|uniref:Uncharacterized protein n=1 Tax=Litomosoides sigmodontis TaxID=42156 RepID=A0A3P7JVS1_LITSI|nr:unnamed protein product [Litomosoides sigmodontis]